MVAEKNIMRQRGGNERREAKEFDERVIEIARISRVAKGGRRIRFRALVVIGDHKGRVGMGVAKATEVAEAVKKATAKAKKHVYSIPIINGTIPHEIYAKHGGSKIMLKPATSGTSIVAGGSIRTVADVVGISDMLAKSLGSANKINNVTATIKALTSFNEDITEKVRSFEKKKVVLEVPSGQTPSGDSVGTSPSPDRVQPSERRLGGAKTKVAEDNENVDKKND